MNYAPTREPRKVQPAGTEPTPPRRKPRGWFREVFDLIRQYREANCAYRAAMKQLKREMKDRAHGRLH